MFESCKQYWDRQRWKAIAASAVLSFLLVGFGVGSSPRWTGALAAPLHGDGSAASATSAGMPGSFASLAERLGPTVVNIRVTKMEPAGAFPGSQLPEGPAGEPFRRFFRDLPQRPESFRMQGSGSGVIISPDGYLLTNNHVVAGAQEVTVTLADQQRYQARIVGRDPKTDLAVLKIDAGNALPVASLGDSTQLRVGEWVLAIGNPFGLSHSVTAGIVSAKGRVLGAGPYDDFIQTDAPINPGNSGGPLFNMQGEMVGITTAIVAHGQGIGFAIPISLAKPLIPQLVSTGEVSRGYLGVSIQTLTPDLAKALKVKEQQGAIVGSVVAGSPAEQAGIKRGDIIVAFNEKSVKNARDLPAMVAETPVGQRATITVWRDGTTHQVPISVGKLSSEQAMGEEASPVAKSQWGVRLQDVTPQLARQHGLTSEHGAIIVGVQPGSPAERAGLQRGDIILEVDRQAVHSAKEVREALSQVEQDASAVLLVQRDQSSLFVPLDK